MYLGYDAFVELKSAKSVENYQPIQFFKDNRDKLNEASAVLAKKLKYAEMLNKFSMGVSALPKNEIAKTFPELKTTY